MQDVVVLGDVELSVADVVAPWVRDPASVDVIDSSRGDDDLRCVLHIAAADGRELGVRVSRNAFTSAETIAELAAGEAHYRSLGMRCPEVVPLVDGSLSRSVDGFLCWAETWLPGPLASEASVALDAERLARELLVTAARACAHPGPVVTARRSWCFIDHFDGDDRDEMDDAADDLHRALAAALPGDPRPDAWLAAHRRRKDAITADYRKLPEAYVQGDLNRGNVVVDGDGRFAGLIDFNLAGMERCLTYLFSEAVVEADTLERAFSLADRGRRDAVTRERFAVVQDHYTFTDLERRLLPEVYRLRMPTFWPVSRMLLGGIADGRAAEVMRFVDRESTRPADEVLALLG